VAKISRLHQELDSSVDATDGIRTCTSSFKELSERIRDDLQARLFLWIPPERSRFYSQKKLFGKLVADKFPQASEDIEEAGKCLALGRGTATVFHLMRVMEGAVEEMARLLTVAIHTPYSWAQILPG